MIRVLYFITGLGTGGAESMLFKLLSSMDRTRFAITVVSLSGVGDYGHKISAMEIPVHSLKIDSVASGIRGLHRAVDLIRTTQPHIIQTILHHADLFGTVAAKLSGHSNLIWNLRCAALSAEDLPRKNLLLVHLLGLLSSIPKIILANSEAGRLAHTQAGYHPHRWEIIPNGFNLKLFSPDSEGRALVRNEFGIGDDCDVIGLVGRYHPMKGHTLFLKAAAVLLKKWPETKFIMVGSNVDGLNIELVNQIKAHRLDSNVKLLGERLDIPRVMNALDILTCSSTSEGFPNVLGEAMACGIPCVATDAGDSKLIIGDTGYVVPIGSDAALAESWNNILLLDPKVRKHLGLSARERIQSLYDIDIITVRYQKLYEELSCAE